MTTAYLFLGHGTRQQHGIDEFLKFVDAVRKELATQAPAKAPLTGHAFLELQAPDIVAGIDSLVEQGATSIVCVPLFLFSAGHMHDDIPSEIRKAGAKHPGLSVRLLESFGEHPALYQVVRSRLEELVSKLRGSRFNGVNEVRAFGLLFLGRGNRDLAAQSAFQQVADMMVEALQSEWDGGWAQIGPTAVGYLAGTGNALEHALYHLAQQGARDIIILPYLWFSGWLTDTLPDRVERWQATRSGSDNDSVRVYIAQHLGLHPNFVRLVANRVQREL